MKQGNGTKVFFIIGFLLLTGYYLSFSLRFWLEERHISSLDEDEQIQYRIDNEDRLADLRARRINFGLDLQGGMYVTLELATHQLIAELARDQADDMLEEVILTAFETSRANNTDVLDEFIAEFERQNPGASLSRYYHMGADDLTRTSTNAEVRDYLNTQRNRAVDRAVEIIRNRIDRFGVTEPSIVRQGANRIVVELPGVDDEGDRVRSLLQGTARLEFRAMADPTELNNAAQRVMQSLNETEEYEDEDGEIQTRTVNPLREIFEIPGSPDYSFGFANIQDTAAVNEIMRRESVRRALPSNVELFWYTRPVDQQGQFLALLGVRDQIALTGEVITDARPSFDPQTNRPEVSMSMNREGARRWSQLTGANIGRPVAIILDGLVYSYPNVQTQIYDGRSSITGLGGLRESEDLANILLSGALPAPLDIIEERTVGATLGEASIQAGLNSVLYGLLIVAIFMIFYYRTGGGIANIALLLNMVFILGILAAFQATLTLPGMAGIVLTIGMAVDANVLIFDRIREEMTAGKSLIAAIDSGYNNAMSAILDANITTFLAAVVLFSFGMGPIKGFAVTLMAGIVASLFSAIIITRVLIDFMTRDKKLAISFG